MKKMNYFISSADGINTPPVINPSSSQFTYQLLPTLPAVKTVKLKHVTLPNTLYNIQDDNNTFILHENSDIPITIPPGYYNVVTLCNTLTQLLASNGTQVYTVTYSSTTFLLTITATTVFILDFDVPFSCASVLGFLHAATESANIQTANNAMQLQINNIFIVIDEFNRGIFGINGTPYTFMIPLDENAGSIINYNNKTTFNQVVQVTDIPLYQLHVRLVNANNELINLHGSDWSMLLEFSI